MTAPRRRRPLVIGHRGARGLRPENTLPSIDAAIAAGAEMIEIDVQLTADGVPAVLHDPRLSPDLHRKDGRWIAACSAPVDRMAWCDLSAYDAGAARPGSAAERAFPRQAGCEAAPVPRLSEVLDRLGGLGVGLLLEIKNDRPADADARRPDILAESVLLEIGGRSDVAILFQSFDWRILGAIGRRDGKARLSALTSAAIPPGNLEAGSPLLGRWAGDVCRHGPARIIADLGWQTWSADFRDLTRAGIEGAHRLGLPVFAWTVNDPATARTMAEWNVDGLITDYPDMIAAPKAAGSDLRRGSRPQARGSWRRR